MAQSGSFTTSGSGNYALEYSKLTFSWSATQNIAQNKSTVNWTLTVSTGGGTYFSRYVKINGGIKYAVGVPYQDSSPSGDYYSDETQLASGSFDVFHDNDGIGSFSVDIGACIKYSYWYMNPSYQRYGQTDTGNWNSKGSKTFTLDTIPRHPATITNATVINTKYADYVVGGYSTSTIDITTTLGDAPSISKYVVMYGNNKVYEGDSQPSFTVPSISSDDSGPIVYKVYAIDSYNLVSNIFECSSFIANKYVIGKATSSPITQRYNEEVNPPTLDEDGTSAQCQLTFKSSTIGGNPISTTVTVTINNQSGSITTSESSYTLNEIVGNKTLLGGQSYSVVYKLTDALRSNVIIATDVISVSFHTMNFSPNGTGVGIGQLGVDGYFDINNMIVRVGGIKLIDIIYPVGSYYMCNSNTDPNNLGGLFAGTTWVKLEGAFLYAAENSGTYAVGRSGGDKNSVAAHTHPDANFQTRGFYVPYDVYNLVEAGTNTSRTTGGDWNNTAARADVGGRTDIITIKTASEGIADGNMPPWKAVYMWERTA